MKKLFQVGTCALMPYLTKILRMYGLWSCIWLVMFSGRAVIKGIFGIDFVFGFLRDFLLFGTVDTYWYFPAVVYSIVLLTLLYRFAQWAIIPLALAFFVIGMGSSVLECIGLGDALVFSSLLHWEYFGCARKILCNGFTYIALSYYLVRTRSNLPTMHGDKGIFVLSAAFVLMIIETCVCKALGFDLGLSPSFFLYAFMAVLLLYLLDRPLPGQEKVAHALHGFANFTYLFHPFVVNLLLFIGPRIMDGGIPNTARFIIVVLMSLLVGLLLLKIDNKNLNRLMY